MLKKAVKFLKDVWVEMKKVAWPKKNEIYASTAVVIISSVILGLFLGLVDFVLSKGIEPTLQGSPTYWSALTVIVFGFILWWIYQVIQS